MSSYNETSADLSWVLIKPRLTEKAAVLGSDQNVYTFDVAPRANKIQIKKAIKVYYKADATRVNIIVGKKKPTRTIAGGARGRRSGYKKAMVFLKKGQTIDFT